jgi:cyclophilin family peptidyl-prolyl cis-trans isomerase
MKKQWLVGLALLALVGCQQVGSGNGGSPVSGAGTSTPESGQMTIQPVGTATPAFSASPTPTVSGSPSPAAGASASPVAGTATPAVATSSGKPLEDSLKPLSDKTGRFPVLTRKETVKMVTTGGEVIIEVYPEAAPNAVARFLELVKSGFYDDTPVSRVVKRPSPFVAQFGINWRPPHNAWEKKEFKDDPSYFALERGTICFAKAGIDHNSTQVFINYADNSRLAEPSMNFAAFGKVVKGMDVVDGFVPVGEEDSGLDQFRLWTDGGNYLESLSVKPTMIEKMTVVQ